MTQRERFFNLLGQRAGRDMPFFPDITDWYIARRTRPGQAQPYKPGELIPDAAPIHRESHSMPSAYSGLTLLDFYREFDWGFPVHIYDWYETSYSAPVSREQRIEGRSKVTVLHTPRGELTSVELLSADGSWAPREHFVKKLGDLELMRMVIEHQRFTPRYDHVREVLEELGGQGVADLAVMRSPFGKLVHWYMGFEQVVYALYDHPGVLEDFMEFQEKRDLELVSLAAQAPGKLVIISDHADENLIAPPHYERFCIPFYRKACAMLHEAGKLVSTHLDGNFKGLFPLLGRTDFDFLDGCTPAPMNNFEVEELAAALPEKMTTYLGVPASLFCQGLETGEILAFGERIHKALAGRVILNVGDILPPNGDIEQVIALGEHTRALNAKNHSGA